jgi:hypothetical protein
MGMGRDFLTKFANPQGAVEAKHFWGWGSPRWPSAAMVARAQSDQTNIKQQTLHTAI